MKTYLAGPISLGGTLPKKEIEKNLARFHQIAATLREGGMTVLSPAELPDQETQEAYMRLCLPLVLEADRILLLPGWRDSPGARTEREVAKAIGIEIWEIHG